MKTPDELLITRDATIRQAISRIDRGGCGIAVVVDEEWRLIGTVTDGDVRRAMLAKVDLDEPVTTLLARKASSPYARPITAPVGTPPGELLERMHKGHVRQIPLLDQQGHVADLVTMDDLLPGGDLQLQAVIMAGGFGTRLRPLTEDVPKPMLRVGGRPVMELIVEQLQQAGIRQVNVTTHYKPEKIIEHFGDGRAFGIELNYVNEDRPLGTGGALGLLPAPREPLLVINGDILTQVSVRAMFAYHREHQADLTVGVVRYEMKVPFGVIEGEGSYVRRLREKPEMSFFVNAGLYLLEPSVYQYIPNGQPFHMTDLIQWLLDAGRPVASFPIREYWLDIGRHADYAQAQKDIEEGRMTL